jgi:rhamnosyltransferase
MHDWWLALCGAACGKIGYVNKPMTLYRQHHINTIGAKGLLNSMNPFQHDPKVRWHNGRKHFVQSICQADQLKKRIKNRKIKTHPSMLECIDTFANCLKLGRINRLKTVRKYGIQRQGIIYGLIFYMLLLISPGSQTSDEKIA